MKNLKQRVAAGAASLALVGTGVAPMLEPTPAEATTVPIPNVYPFLGIDINWGCVAGVTALGIGIVATALAPPAGIVWNVAIWGAAGYGAYTTAGDCMNAPDKPPLVCGPLKYTSSDNTTKYYYDGCSGSGVGGGGGGSW